MISLRSTFESRTLIELKQTSPGDQIKGLVQDSMWALKFNMKPLKKAKKTYWPKCCEYNNKDGVNSLNILSNKNYLVSSRNFVNSIKLVSYGYCISIAYITIGNYGLVISTCLFLICVLTQVNLCSVVSTIRRYSFKDCSYFLVSHWGYPKCL